MERRLDNFWRYKGILKKTFRDSPNEADLMTEWKNRKLKFVNLTNFEYFIQQEKWKSHKKWKKQDEKDIMPLEIWVTYHSLTQRKPNLEMDPARQEI